MRPGKWMTSVSGPAIFVTSAVAPTAAIFQFLTPKTRETLVRKQQTC
jgi:hypothetical protein